MDVLTNDLALLGKLPIGLPPDLHDETEQMEHYLTDVSRLNLHNRLDECQRYVARTPCHRTVYSMDVSPVQTDLVVLRDHITGRQLDVIETVLLNPDKSAKNSTSLMRLPGNLKDGVLGTSTNYPFWPGGLDEPNLEELGSVVGSVSAVDFDNDLLVVPPGFSNGMTFERVKSDVIMPSSAAAVSVISFADILGQGQDIDFGLGTDASEDVPKRAVEGDKLERVDSNFDDKLEIDLTATQPTLPAAEALKVEKWAVNLDSATPIKDFHLRVPHMALKFSFELDTFQKHAILMLESRQSVFVAAHTSAGKTAVAEYAIALSLRHMTKTVYTSPIKALSNQKFRDFKDKFEDVGLITGDVQIKSEASCLVMTTEILRSMLYAGSDVIRDLEWVVFDEVHYINDVERGVVWEEVLIMLPQHVNIVMLSATVPNTMEFAEWVGRIKKKKIYVSSTLHRPVPLEHFLYTGNSAKTSNELFLILDAKKSFDKVGYQKAVDAKKERASKSSQTTGSRGPRHSFNPAVEKNIWLSLINMLEKKEKLPAVAFVLSRKRILDTAEFLTSIDLTSSAEKSHIHLLFKRSIDRLKEPDRKLPQILQMKELLTRGIGIHHSGVLPILKEVVELLFQNGWVKILFATETFAIGVNMPARTVVFDTMTKHDGKSMRDLLPGEYIQMAGRAGRRGLDSTGTVILVCKGDPPELSDLHKMMMGKPAMLESQFRVTYSMILNLLRVESLRVEDMMKHSFREFHSQTEVPQQQKKLKEKLGRLEELKKSVFVSDELQQYYTSCDEYWRLHADLRRKLLAKHQSLKLLSPGRVVVIECLGGERNILAVVLQGTSTAVKDGSLKALAILDEQDSSKSVRNPSEESTSARLMSELPSPVTALCLYRPEGRSRHCLVNITADQLSIVTTKTIKVDAEKILADYSRRQMSARFKNDPPEKCTELAAQELVRLLESNPSGLPAMDPVKDLHVQDLDIVQDYQRFKYLQETLPTDRITQQPNFDEDFIRVREINKLKSESAELKHLLSDEGLAMLPDYRNKILVLRDLGYIDNNNVVQLKGRIACETSGNNELIITELVFDNALSSLHPTEIASLLSCLVFEQKRCSVPQLNRELKACKERFEGIAQRLGDKQHSYQLESTEEYMEQFNFGLMEVVFEWARGMTFADIMLLTDVQEGIIVRCIQRLYELLKDVRNASKIIGDPILTSKMEEAATMIKRDIVFSASLYTQ